MNVIIGIIIFITMGLIISKVARVFGRDILKISKIYEYIINYFKKY